MRTHLFRYQLKPSVISVADVRVTLALSKKYVRLGVDVALLRSVPVQMIGREVQQHRNTWVERLHEPQLE